MFFKPRASEIPRPVDALRGRTTEMAVAGRHHVNGRPLKGPYPAGAEIVYFGLGCFWGAERLFWSVPGVFVTAVGYQGGHTPNPTYDEVCSGRTGHTETVKVAFEARTVPLEALLKLFWEEHDPTQGMRQGNDIGTQYRSAIYSTAPEQAAVIAASAARYEGALRACGRAAVTTEIAPARPFYYAESYHQQYLARNPRGYCGLRGTGVSYPLPRAAVLH